MRVQVNIRHTEEHIAILEKERRTVQELLALWPQQEGYLCGDPGVLRHMNYLRELDTRIHMRIRLLQRIVEDFTQLRTMNRQLLLSARDTLNAANRKD